MARYSDRHPAPDDHSDPWPPADLASHAVSGHQPKKKHGWVWAVLAVAAGVVIFALCGGILGSGLTKGNDEAGVNGQKRVGGGQFGTPSPIPTPPKGQGTPKPKVKASVIREGQWVVGEDDVKAGRYKTPGAKDGIVVFCTWTIYASDGGQIVDVGAVSELDSPGRVKLKTGQAFKTSGCRDWSRVSD